MTVQAASSSLERELEYRKKLTAISNQINSADSIAHILMTLKDRIVELLDAERLTIYAVDTKNQELYSLQKVGDVPKEIRVPKSFASIAGFTALSRKTLRSPPSSPDRRSVRWETRRANSRSRSSASAA